jgi:predicted methyltransferase
MRKSFGTAIMVLGAFAITSCGGQDASPEADEMSDAPAADSNASDSGAFLDAAIAGDHRTEEDRARDVFRHPKETLEFFGIEPGMTVVEIWPGGGWYTKIIAPYLKAGGGKFYAAGFPRDGANERLVAALDAFEAEFVSHPEIYGEIEMTALAEGHEIAPAGSADAVLTFRNVHNWLPQGSAENNFAKFYLALKPGGVLGVVDHRADGSDLPQNGSSGYVYTDDVIALAEGAGFEFEGGSEINANPKDTKDHPLGVWTLPPVRRSPQEPDPNFDRARYDAIGESDRLTLKFRKPLAEPEGALLE